MDVALGRWMNRAALAALVVLPTACIDFSCDRQELSDGEQYWVMPSAFDLLGEDSRQVLVGSEFSLELVELAVPGELDPDQGGIGCAAQSGSGVAEALGDGMYRVSDVGPGAIEFAAPGVACPANTDVLIELDADRWSFRGVAPETVVARWIAAADSEVVSGQTSPGPNLAWPGNFAEVLDELRVVEGQDVAALPVLIEASRGQRAEVRFGEPTMVLGPPEVVANLNPDQELPLPPELDVIPEFMLGGHSFELPPLRTVPVDSLTSLELVVAYHRSEGEDRSWGPPRSITAVARDAEGRRVVGLPVEWELVSGRLALYPSEGPGLGLGLGLGSDQLALGDVCRKAPKNPRVREAEIEARVADLVTRVDLHWTALPTDLYDRDDEGCVRSGCALGPTPQAPGPAGLVLLGLLGLRSRSCRRRAARTAAT